MRIWRTFNSFLLKLDIKPPTWEHRLAFYGAHLVDTGAQSATVKSYFSAIKKMLTYVNYDLKMCDVLVNTLTKSCRIINDRVLTRMPIHGKLLEMLLFELERVFSSQFYLEILYKTRFSLAYYGLFRIGELTKSQHVIKAANINIGINKNKILIVLYSSKTHGKESRPQKVKISEIRGTFESTKRFFCPFNLARKYLKLRGGYTNQHEQFFVFRDKSAVSASNVRKVLKTTLCNCNLNSDLFDCHSFRVGRTNDLIKLGYSIEEVKRLGRWKSNAVYKYIR